jgi:hypothetical protein
VISSRAPEASERLSALGELAIAAFRVGAAPERRIEVRASVVALP